MNSPTTRGSIGVLPRRLIATAAVTLGLVGTALVTGPAAPAAGTAAERR